MIKLTFAIGGNLRKVFINKRKISLLTAETGWQPISIDIDNIDEKLSKKISEEEMKLIKEISKLNSEEEIAKDIVKDFQKTGWRLCKKECL